ncbi:MAG: Spy/CpxP family protein refolding chaperone [Gammaproteobacteria bacterium]|nr:Spy/CpxP family protein refolding chaperone [Gammaproteobacteria bacterium]
MERFKSLTVLILLNTILGFGIPVYADGDSGFDCGPKPDLAPPPQHAFHDLFRVLDLTDDQKAQLKSWHEEQAQQNHDRIDAQRKAQREMHELITEDTIDEASIRAIAVELADAQAESAIAHAHFMQQVRSMLTSEQFEKLQEIEKERRERMEKLPPILHR